MTRHLLTLLTFLTALTAHAATGDILFSRVSETGALTPSLVTPATPPSVFGLGAGGISSFELGAGFTLTGGTLSAGAAWGQITGTLADQADLSEALGAKLSTATATTLYAPIAHAHIIGDVTGLQAALDAKLSTTTATTLYAPIAHAHIVGDVTGLQTALDAKEPTQTPASQAEAEAGTETALRSWSPVRVAQAIEALGAGSAASLPRGHIAGLTLSWISTTVIQISAGAARSSADLYDISTPSSGFVNLQKSTSGWAQTAFNGATGGMAGGGAANSNTLYAVYVIYNPTTGLMDALLSTNGTAPSTLPSGYTAYRRIGYVRTAAGSATFLAFTQHGDWFTFDSGYAVSTSITLSTTVADYTITGPPSRCLVDLAFSTNPVTNIYLTNGVGLISGTSNNDYNAIAGRNSGSSGHVLMPFGAGIRVRADAASGTPTLYLTLRGWMDPRGRHD